MDFIANNILFDFILVGGITLNVVVLLRLFRNQQKELHGKLLISIFLSTLMMILFAYGFLHKIRWIEIVSWMFLQSAAWYVGPLLLLYVKSLYLPTQGLFIKNILHFIPAILFILFVSFPSLLSIIMQEYLFEYVSYIMEEGSAIVDIAQILFLAFYCLLALKELEGSKQLIKKVYANLENLGIQWISILLLGLLAVCLIDFSTSVYELLLGELPYASGYLSISALALLVGYLAYNGLTQSRILLPAYLWDKKLPEDSSTQNPKVGDPIENPTISTLSEYEINQMSRKLEEVMDLEKPYTHNSLTLGELASLMKVSQRKLSTFLNQHLELSFFEFINKKRVEEVKKMIDSGKYAHFTLLAIGLEAGFNSKTSFYRTFKKVAGIPPSAYKGSQDPK